jgi:streptogramin lyase
MRSLAAVAAAAAAFGIAAPAHAGIVVTAPLGSSMKRLVVDPNGGAWVLISEDERTAIGRVGLDGSLRTSAVDAYDADSVLGPDGKAWYRVDAASFLRSDANGTVDRLTVAGEDALLGDRTALGTDGTVWTSAFDHDGVWHVAPDGTATKVPVAVPKGCRSDYGDAVTASDGALWLADWSCGRLTRITAAGTSRFAAPEPLHLAADRTGGVWVGGSAEDTVRHVDASGAVRTFRVPDAAAYVGEVAVSPDGSAWFAGFHCRLLRISEAGELSVERSPIHAAELGFDASGALWLMGRARIARLAPGERAAACDERAPAVRIERFRERMRVSVRALRRGFTVRVREPLALRISADYSDRPRHTIYGQELDRVVRAPRGGRVHYRIPPKRLRQLERGLAKGGRPTVEFNAFGDDVEGNTGFASVRLRVTR